MKLDKQWVASFVLGTVMTLLGFAAVLFFMMGCAVYQHRDFEKKPDGTLILNERAVLGGNSPFFYSEVPVFPYGYYPYGGYDTFSPYGSYFSPWVPVVPEKNLLPDERNQKQFPKGGSSNGKK